MSRFQIVPPSQNMPIVSNYVPSVIKKISLTQIHFVYASEIAVNKERTIVSSKQTLDNPFINDCDVCGVR